MDSSVKASTISFQPPLFFAPDVVAVPRTFQVKVYLPKNKVPFLVQASRGQSVAQALVQTLHSQRLNWQKNTCYLLYTGIAVSWQEDIATVCAEELRIEPRGAGDHSRSILPGMHVIMKSEVHTLLGLYLQSDGVYLMRPSETLARQYVISVTSQQRIKNFKVIHTHTPEGTSLFHISSSRYFQSLPSLLEFYKVAEH